MKKYIVALFCSALTANADIAAPQAGQITIEFRNDFDASMLVSNTVQFANPYINANSYGRNTVAGYNQLITNCPPFVTGVLDYSQNLYYYNSCQLGIGFSIGLFMHEFGHAMGANEGFSINLATGASSKYGDPSDPMGASADGNAGTGRHYSAPNKETFGWLNGPDSLRTLATANVDGDYPITGLEEQSLGDKAVRVLYQARITARGFPTSYESATDYVKNQLSYFYLELRRDLVATTSYFTNITYTTNVVTIPKHGKSKKGGGVTTIITTNQTIIPIVGDPSYFLEVRLCTPFYIGQPFGYVPATYYVTDYSPMRVGESFSFTQDIDWGWPLPYDTHNHIYHTVTVTFTGLNVATGAAIISVHSQ